MELLFQGNKERTQEPTAANKTSSRSHAVLQVIVKQQNRVRNTLQEIRVGKLFMIDLAGSERAANTHNTGKRMVEGAHINRSLLALGNCITALSEFKNRLCHLIYRFIVFNTSYISVTSCRSFLLVKETEVPGENH